MGLDMELEFEKYCRVGLSPKTVLPSHRHCSKVEKQCTKGKPTCRNDLLSLKEDFTENSFYRYRSSCCKNIPSRTDGLEGSEELKRGSIYQSSKAVRKIKEMGAVEGRRKIELSRSSDASFSFRVVDSLCSSDEESLHVEQKRSPVMSLNSDSNTTSVSKPYIEPCSPNFLDLSCPGHVSARGVSSDGFFKICVNSDYIENHSAETVERNSIEGLKFRCDQVVGPLNDGNDLRERDTVLTLHKSLSAKLAMPYTPSRSESDHSRASPKARFSPIRRMFDPFMKSKSQRSPLGSVAEPGEVTTTGPASIRRNKTFRKSLLHDFSNTTQNKEFGPQFVKRDHHQSVVPCSPAHLHGCLKLENKHGVPFFEFSVKYPEDVFVAKTWKADNALNLVYTFHSVHNRKKNNASGWGSRDSSKESSVVGQMQVSCYLCSELKDGAFDNSMVTEFVLYDIAHARKSVAAQENYNSSSDVVKPPIGSNEGLVRGTDDVSDSVKLKLQAKHASGNSDFNSSTPYPWAPADLQPNLEVAAIVIQVPFEKRESLKYKRGDKISDQAHQNLLDLSMVEQRKTDICDNISLAKVNVVTPTGNHGLPSAESRGPSPLLDRWRLGGGCDCGGWDMACPLIVFGNPNLQSAEDHPLMDSQRPWELFVQGTKESTPALTMTVIEEGQYAVDFHAQLSTLQAFSICVAILHSTEACTAIGPERNRQLLQCNSLKVLIEEKVKFLIEAVTEEEKRKAIKTMEEIPPSFVLNPPFSPIARV